MKSRRSSSDHESDQATVVFGANAANRCARADNSWATAGGRRRKASKSSDSFALSCICVSLQQVYASVAKKGALPFCGGDPAWGVGTICSERSHGRLGEARHTLSRNRRVVYDLIQSFHREGVSHHADVPRSPRARARVAAPVFRETREAQVSSSSSDSMICATIAFCSSFERTATRCKAFSSRPVIPPKVAHLQGGTLYFLRRSLFVPGR